MSAKHSCFTAILILGLAVLSAPAGAQVAISGFGDGTNFTMNGNGTLPTISGGVLTITDGNGYEAHSVFYNAPQTIGLFEATFVFEASGSRSGDGMAFVIQNDPRGANARGGYGSGLGYGNSDGDPGNPIVSSVAFEINLYNGHTRGTNVVTNGAWGNYQPTGIAAFQSGHQFQVKLSYDGTLLSTSLLDLTTSQVFQASYSVNLPSVLGGSTGYVGFTGSTGAATAIQSISNFTFTIVPEPPSVVLLCLGIMGLVVSARRRRARPARTF